MADSRLLVSNLALAATWSQTTGGTATGYALTNLLNSKRGLPWRSSTTTGNQVIVASFSATTVKAIALINYLAHAGGTVKAETKNGGGSYSNFGGGTGLFTLPASNRTRLVALYDAAGVTATDVRLTFTNTAGVNSVVELGVAFISTYLQPAQNVAPGITLSQVDPSIMRTSEGGQEQIWQKRPYATPTATYRPSTAADRDLLLAAFDVAGARLPVVFAIEPSNIDLTFYGYLPSTLRAAHLPQSGGTGLWQIDVPFREAC